MTVPITVLKNEPAQFSAAIKIGNYLFKKDAGSFFACSGREFGSSVTHAWKTGAEGTMGDA